MNLKEIVADFLQSVGIQEEAKTSGGLSPRLAVELQKLEEYEGVKVELSRQMAPETDRPSVARVYIEGCFFGTAYADKFVPLKDRVWDEKQTLAVKILQSELDQIYKKLM